MSYFNEVVTLSWWSNLSVFEIPEAMPAVNVFPFDLYQNSEDTNKRKKNNLIYSFQLFVSAGSRYQVEF